MRFSEPCYVCQPLVILISREWTAWCGLQKTLLLASREMEQLSIRTPRSSVKYQSIVQFGLHFVLPSRNVSCNLQSPLVPCWAILIVTPDQHKRIFAHYSHKHPNTDCKGSEMQGTTSWVFPHYRYSCLQAFPQAMETWEL